MLSFLREQGSGDQPIGPGQNADGGETQDFLTVASNSRNLRKSTILVVILVAIGLVGLWFMIHKSRPQSASAEPAKEEETKIEVAISRLTGVRSEMANHMDEVVTKFYEFSDVCQVEVGELSKNPFEVEMPAKPEEEKKEPTEEEKAMQAALARREELKQKAAALQLLSIMRAEEGNACMINDQILTQGDRVEAFTIDRIGGDFVVLVCSRRNRSHRGNGRFENSAEVDAMMLRFLSNAKNRGSSGPGPADDACATATPAYSAEEEVRGLSDLYSPEPTSQSHIRDAADILLEMGKITDEQYGRLRRELMNRPGVDAATWLLKEGVVQSDDVLEAKAKLGGMEFRRIDPEEVEKTAYEKLDVNFIQRSSIVPVKIEENTLLVATSEPSNIFAIEDVKRQTGMDVRVVVCTPDDIAAVCESFKEEDEVDYSLDEIINDMTEVEVVQDKEEESEDLESMAGQSPVIKFVNYLISNAVREGASDIHIEPKEIRDEGSAIASTVCCSSAMQAPNKMHPAIVSRIKIMANLDISERRLPQDGKVSAIVRRTRHRPAYLDAADQPR